MYILKLIDIKWERPCEALPTSIEPFVIESGNDPINNSLGFEEDIAIDLWTEYGVGVDDFKFIIIGHMEKFPVE